MKRIYLLICVLVAISMAAEAQSFYAIRRNRSVIATVGLNSSTYYGDLKDDSDILDAKPSLSLGLMASVSSVLSIRSEFSWLTFSGRDAESIDNGKTTRNLSFTSSNYELSVSGLVNLIPHRGRFYQRPRYNVYGFLGVGALYFNPKAELNGQKYPLQPLQTEGVKYSKIALVIPYGAGAKLKLSPFINLAIEAGWRKTFTDYIDDVSTVYKDNASFTNPIAQKLADRRPEIDLPLLEAGHIRGNPDKKDAYMLLTVKVEYYLPYEFGNQRRKLYNRKRKAFYR